MAEDTEKRFERAMNRLFSSSSRSMSSPPTPASSSAGPASPPLQGKKGDMGKHELGPVSKATSVSKIGLCPLQAAGNMSSFSLSPWNQQQPVCRPWDRGDLLRRLATFKSITWFGKPKAAGPVSCARKGWSNVDVDLIACEACSSQLSFPIPPSWSQQQAESAAETFSQKLDTGHKTLCPWRGNACSEMLAHFPPTPVQALVEGYKDRCDVLLRLSALPVVASSAIEYLKLSRGSQIDSLLAQLFPTMAEALQKAHHEGNGMPLHPSNSSYYQSQKLISLCGWELRFLPYVVDCEDDSTQSARSIHTVGKVQGRFHRDGGHGPSVILCSRTESLKDKLSTMKNTSTSETRLDPASAVLDCSLCGASVGLWSFITVSRPSCLMGLVSPEPVSAPKDVVETAACGISATSCFGHTYSGDCRQKHRGQPDETEAVTSEFQKVISKSGVLDLRLTIAGGPPPTQISSSGLISPFFPVSQLGTNADKSEVGEWSGPVDYQEQKYTTGQASSITGKARNRTLDEDNTGFNSLVRENEDDDEVAKGRGILAGSSKCGHTVDFSQTTAVVKPGISQNDDEGNKISKRKRKRGESVRPSLPDNMHPMEHHVRDYPRYSSVDAVDTCYHTKQENSIESVEMPHDADSQGTAVSRENNVAAGTALQAQQSTCGQEGAKRVLVAPGLSKSDEGGDDGTGTNVAAISTGTGKEGGVSVGMGSAKFDTSGSQDTIVHDSRLSVPRPESGLDEVDGLAEITENTGRDIFHKGKKAWENTDEFHQRAEFSTFSGQKRSFKGGLASLVGESSESGGKGDQGGEDHITGQDVQGECNAGVVSRGKIETEETNINTFKVHGKVEETPVSPGKSLKSKILLSRESREFDPVRQHRHFCPWVNANVVTAACSSDTHGGTLCGWQLTLDALEAPATVVESESASSKYNVDALASVRKMLGSRSKPNRNQRNSSYG